LQTLAAEVLIVNSGRPRRASTEALMWVQPRTLTGYLIAIVIVFGILNGLVWLVGAPSFRDRFGVFSAGFLLGAFGMYIAAWLYGYSRAP
jgi:hypothetical protein